MKGYVQVYTGDGKGKTTAALGLALRATGAGLRVYICQFLKSGDYSEIKALASFGDQITVRQFGTGKFVKGAPSDEDRVAAAAGFASIQEAFSSGKYDVVIAEEISVAVSCGLLSAAQVCDLIDQRPDNVELVITGRGAPSEVIAKADLVTEMKPVKHYYFQGVMARTGIEK
ncbi:cob(I)yrinic acid a,c-diamide adenosyltransferase [Desulfosudis oleivorans]|uniref:corrinoid adenosyltransferase n=1 Tax=Desulfosudis oleivorans (strain DSM 6200 / JCM 39069 / Hxd3) TaxID=96561 RepID=A8ZY27_DESOH|nr:cob(I)yrinic acid a,c-diamide adenosyltransferase [Desulfosudis oleivorans]ABW67034.1 cob(I)alamin adenosyltransferase [Desulfosudis oleivorans Hxd3]